MNNQKGSVLLEFSAALLLLVVFLSLTAFALSHGWQLRLREYYAFENARKALERR